MLVVSVPTVQTQRNGEPRQGDGCPPNNPDQSLQAPTSGIRGTRYRKAAIQVATWPSEYPGMGRWEALKQTVKLIREKLDVHEDDVAVLIQRNLPMGDKEPYSVEEIMAAVRGFANPHLPPPPKPGPSKRPQPAPGASANPPGYGPSVVDRMRERDEAARKDREPEDLIGIMASQIRETKIDWLLENWVARGYYTMVSGKAGVGKSTFFTGMAKLARRTMWFCGEERLGNVVKARLRAHEIPDDAVEFFTREHRVVFPNAQDAIIKRARATRTDLMVIDPLTAFLPLGAEANINEQMLPVLESLDNVAERTGAAVLVCLHPGKAANNIIRGASVLFTHPRTVLELLKHDGPPPRRLMQQAKNNQPCGVQPAREYHAIDVGAGIGVFRLGEQMNEAEAQFAAEVPDRLDRRVVQECEDWLKGMLAEGDKPRKQIMSSAKDEGYAGRTVERAADKLGVIRERGNFRAGEGSIWKLPPHLMDTSTPFDQAAPIPD